MKIVTFGELMMRLTPPGYARLTQARSFEVTFGGAEANVAVSLACMGEDAEFVSKIPANDIGQAAVNSLRAWGVGTAHLLSAASGWELITWSAALRKDLPKWSTTVPVRRLRRQTRGNLTGM